jgi:hydrogenase maturation protein HypF
MAPDFEAARSLVELSGAEQELLEGRERPIVIARRRPGAAVAESVAPRSADLGVMLPYSPLHHLLLDEAERTLVMTSANVSDEPIAYEDEDALDRLARIADGFLLHDRPIHMRTDDSVVRSVRSRPAPLMLRRSRGYVPEGLMLPVEAERPLLACGAELKSTFCVARGRRAWVSHHIGDLENWETLSSFRSGVEHFERLFAVAPAVVAHDLHPDYLSTKYALEREGVEHVGVQHHHAHLAACLAEHGEAEPVVGAIYDGTGYGPDGTVWGGELLVGGLEGFERAGLLWPVRLPGGAAAIREPWRMACAWLVAAGEDEPAVPATLAAAVDATRWRQVAELARTGAASPQTTSMGRLFDAVSALCGVRATVNYEGQAATELEALADPGERAGYPLPLLPDGALDARPTVLVILDDLAAGVEPAAVSARFHNAVATATAQACADLARRGGLHTAVLSGGVFQNRLLLDRTVDRLAETGLRVLVPERLPPNDGGISFGQAAVAAARLPSVS